MRRLLDNKTEGMTFDHSRLVGGVCGEYHAPCTLKKTFIDVENDIHIVADLKGIDSPCSLVVVKSHRIDCPIFPIISVYVYTFELILLKYVQLDVTEINDQSIS
jgi:hypothetical protein